MNEQNQDNVPKLAPAQNWVKLVIVYLFIPLILFLCAGDIGWWQAWVFTALILASGVGGRILAERHHPGLMIERQSKDTFAAAKPWDKVLSPLMSFSVGFPPAIVSGLDHRFGWSPEFPWWVMVIGLAVVGLGFSFAVWALVENKFFSGVVRIQTDRQHVVCDTGPYRIVRHPGYVGNLYPLFGYVLAFSSLWALAPAVFGLVVIVTRTILEDHTLQMELPGYKEYTQRVRYKLLPGVF